MQDAMPKIKLFSWGANTNGQLGHDLSSEQISRPTEIKNELLASLIQSCQPDSQILIHGGGTQVMIYIPEKQTLLHLGVKSALLRNHPPSSIFHPKIVSKNLRISTVSCGWEFNLVLASDNQVYSFGENKFGQLGRSSDPAEFLPIPNFRAKKVSAGLRHAAGISTSGHIYVWGDNSKSQIGLGTENKIISVPTQISQVQFLDVKCGKSFILALDTGGSFWGCGSNKFGQLGHGHPLFLPKLTKLNINLPSKVQKFECGWTHVLVLLENSRLMSWGRNIFSQLGISIEKDIAEEPCYVQGIHEPVKDFVCGSEHNLVLSCTGNLYAWGWNEHENCGVKSSRVSFCEHSGVKLCEDCVLTPTIVGIHESVVSIGCGNGNGFAICQ